MGTFHLLFAQLPDGFSILVMAESTEDEAHKKLIGIFIKDTPRYDVRPLSHHEW